MRALLRALQRLFAFGSRVEIHEYGVTVRPPARNTRNGATVHTVVRSRATPSGRVAVQADVRPYWLLRGWRRVDGKLAGAFRTRLKSFVGQITFDRLGNPSFYVLNPPEAVLRSAHGACFRRRKEGWYWIHFNVGKDVDAGIIAVEEIIAQALGC